MSASIHDKLNRVRKPRVHITYEVETEDAQVERELPFVVGVLGDRVGHRCPPSEVGCRDPSSGWMHRKADEEVLLDVPRPRRTRRGADWATEIRAELLSGDT